MNYGVYDTKDNCWIGDNDGPALFEELDLARATAQVVQDRVAGDLGLGDRFRAKEFTDRQLRFKDEIATKRTTLESLQRLEGEA